MSRWLRPCAASPPMIPKTVRRGIPSQSANRPQTRVSSISVSPTSKKTAQILNGLPLCCSADSLGRTSRHQAPPSCTAILATTGSRSVLFLDLPTSEEVQAGRNNCREQSRYGVTALRSRSELVGIASFQRILNGRHAPLARTESIRSLASVFDLDSADRRRLDSFASLLQQPAGGEIALRNRRRGEALTLEHTAARRPLDPHLLQSASPGR